MKSFKNEPPNSLLEWLQVSSNPSTTFTHNLELNDIMFFVNSFKNLDNMGHSNILNYIKFCDLNTRSSSAFKLKHNTSKNNKQRHLYFNRLPWLWNSMPSINFQSSLSTIKAAAWSHLIFSLQHELRLKQYMLLSLHLPMQHLLLAYLIQPPITLISVF